MKIAENSSEVLFISHDASGTGAPYVLLLLLQHIKAHTNLRVRIVLADGGARATDFRAIGPTYNVTTGEGSIAPTVLRWAGKVSWRLQRWLKLKLLGRYLSQHPCSLIYSNTITNGELLAILPPDSPPVLTHVHELTGMFEQCRAAGHLHHTLRRTNHFITVAEAVSKNLIMNYGITPKSVTVIPGFIPLDKISEVSVPHARSKIRLALGLAEDDLLVIGCGQFNTRKGPDLFIDVAERVGKKLGSRAVRFVWVGGVKGTSEYAVLAQSITDRALDDEVQFVGHRTDYLDYLAAGDVFLMTSREDPFPLVVLESAALGVPIVCFAEAGGTPEFVSNDAGFCVALTDVDAMAKACVTLLSSAELRSSFGAIGRRRAYANHSVAAGASRICALIEDLAQPTRN